MEKNLTVDEMNELNALGEIIGAKGQEVADPVNSEALKLGGEVGEVADPQTSAEIQEVAEPGKTNSDMAFANMRRALEATKRENEILKAQTQRLLETLKSFGFTGENADDYSDALIAYQNNKSVSDVRDERLNAERENERIRQMEEELNYFRGLDVKNRMANDLIAIQKINGDIKSLDEMPDEFFNLISAGVPANLAYKVIYDSQKENDVKAPPVTGPVNTKTSTDKDFYTSEEVSEIERSNPQLLDDPVIMQKIKNSMTKWK